MYKPSLFVIVICILFLILGCSKKHNPGKTVENNSVTANNTDSIDVKKIIKPKRKEPVAKIISVNDNVAHKSVDGRLYYDLLGHRYWKNYKDGKYYLFNQAMYDNADFKPK